MPDEVREHLTIPSSRITPDPLYSQLHDGASSLQFTHSFLLQGSGQRTLTRDQRPFLHPESLQTLYIHSSMTVLLLFSSLTHSFYRIQVREHWHEIRDHSFIQNHSRLFIFTAPWRCFFSSVHSLILSTGFRSENTDTRSETIPSSRITPDPLYSQLHDGASSLQFTSLILSTGFRSENTWHEIRDHSFIQNHSRLFIFTAPWRCFFSSVHSLILSTGFRSEDWNGQSRSLVLGFVFGLLYGWKIQTWPIKRFLSLVYFFYLLVFDRIHDAMCLNKMSRTSSRNIGPQHHKYSSIFHCTHGVLFIPVFTKPILSVCC